MIRKYLLSFGIFVLAFLVLAVSVLHTSSVSYAFSATPSPSSAPEKNTIQSNIEYQLPYPGSILPDNPFWLVKAFRDKVWYVITLNPLKKAELSLLFSDKRLAASKILFDNKKPDVAFSTLSKGEKYLETAFEEEEIARKEGMDTSSFLTKLATASLKHRQIIEQEIIPVSPDQAKPEIVKAEDYSKNVYKYSRDTLNTKGITPPSSPFSGD